MRLIKTDFPDRHCQCGALVEPGMRRCRKCRARSRWYRHKAHRARPGIQRRRRAGTPPRTVKHP
jgi:hypothetical protein